MLDHLRRRARVLPAPRPHPGARDLRARVRRRRRPRPLPGGRRAVAAVEALLLRVLVPADPRLARRLRAHRARRARTPSAWPSGRADARRSRRPTTFVDVGDFLAARRAALLAHRTQIDPESHWMRVPDDLMRSTFPWEEYVLARSLVAGDADADEPESDLFAGVRAPTDVARGSGGASVSEFLDDEWIASWVGRGAAPGPTGDGAGRGHRYRRPQRRQVAPAPRRRCRGRSGGGHRRRARPHAHGRLRRRAAAMAAGELDPSVAFMQGRHEDRRRPGPGARRARRRPRPSSRRSGALQVAELAPADDGRAGACHEVAQRRVAAQGRRGPRPGPTSRRRTRRAARRCRSRDGARAR